MDWFTMKQCGSVSKSHTANHRLPIQCGAISKMSLRPIQSLPAAVSRQRWARLGRPNAWHVVDSTIPFLRYILWEFPSTGVTTIAGWLKKKPNRKWMMTGGSLISRTPSHHWVNSPSQNQPCLVELMSKLIHQRPMLIHNSPRDCW